MVILTIINKNLRRKQKIHRAFRKVKNESQCFPEKKNIYSAETFWKVQKVHDIYNQ